jgi:hypothetical protein
MLNRFLAAAAILLLCISCAFPQISADNNKAENDEKFHQQAVTFLRETYGEVSNLRTIENRISFSSELAGLMWYHDEAEARSMFAAVINDFRELILQYDGQMNMFATQGDEDPYSGGFLFREVTDKARIAQRFRIAMAVRQQIATSLAEHDADLALTFYFDSQSAVSNPELRKQAEDRYDSFENKLIAQLAEKDPDKALKFARKSLGSGFESRHFELLQQIYSKNPDLAVSFGADILSELKQEKPQKLSLWSTGQMLEWGTSILDEARKNGKTRLVYTETELRGIADILSTAFLARDQNELEPMEYTATSYTSTIARYSPGRAAQIRTKFGLKADDERTASAPSSRYRVSNSNRANTIGAAMNTNTGRYEQERQKQQLAEQEMFKQVTRIGDKQIPKEEREKIVGQARSIIAATPGRDKKITALSMLAAQVAHAGDKELASDIMKDAATLVNPDPRNYQDFMLSWMLASGYAAADPDKAFPLLEDIIGRANDTLSAFVRVGEFIDVSGEMIRDGEVQVGAFGGSMVRGLTGSLTMADSTVLQLAKADFDRTRSLTNRFERPEIRTLAKMLVIRAALGPQPKSTTDPNKAANVESEETDEP